MKIFRHCASYNFHQIKKIVKSVTKRSQNVNYIDVQRIQILVLYLWKIFELNACTTVDIKHSRTVRRLLQKTKNRNFDSEIFSVLKIEYVQNAIRSNRSIICDFAKKKTILISNKYISLFFSLCMIILLTNSVQKNRNDREMSVEILKYEHDISIFIIRCIFKKNDFHCVKFTRKSNFTNKMKQNRYEFVKKYENWTIENWKNVIWIDEISVIMCKNSILCEKFHWRNDKSSKKNTNLT